MLQNRTELYCTILLFSTLLITGCAGNAQAGAAPTLQPTETPVALVTPTSVPPPPPMTIPTVNWGDLSVFKQAMKPQFAGDVDQQAPNANRYLILAQLSFEPDAILRGAERVRYTNHSPNPLTEIVFRLYPNAPALGGRMTVSNLSVDGQPVTPAYYQLNSVMRVPLAQPLLPKASVELTMDFTVTMIRGLMASYGRFGYVNDVVSGTAWYPTLSVYDLGVGWWTSQPPPQGDPAYTEVGLYDVRLTLPADLTTVASGKEIETTANADGTITHRSVTGPMHDYAFQASRRYMLTSTEVDGITINVVHYKDTAGSPIDGTNDAVRYARTAVTTYDRTFGEYPYQILNVVENPTPTGVEFPGLVQIGDRSWIQGQSYLEVVIAHEIGHQWFYAIVGNNQVEHPWLDESLTSYTEIVYMRAAYPTGTKAQDYVDRDQKSYNGYTGSGQTDLPLDLPVGSYGGYSYGLIVYTKGPLFYVELERQTSRDTVYRALHTYFERYKYNVATSTDVLNTFEDVSGKNLTAVFSKWVGDAYLHDAAPNPPLPLIF